MTLIQGGHRPAVRLSSLCAVAITFAGITTVPRTALGCTCLALESPCGSMRPGSAIFIGKVVAVEPAYITETVALTSPRQAARTETITTPIVRYRFQLTEPLYGTFDSNTVTVVSRESRDGSCGRSFSLGIEYVVYASQGSDGELHDGACSRTHTLQPDDIEVTILRESRRGSVRPRLLGGIIDQRQRLDGDYGRSEWREGVAGVSVMVRGNGKQFVTKTDSEGRFVIVDVMPGDYDVRPALPPGREVVLDSNTPTKVDRCSGEILFVTSVKSLRGTIRSRDGSPVPAGVRVRAVPVESSASPPSRNRSTSAFTETDGTWTFHGLPPGRYRLGVNVLGPPTPTSPYPAEWYSMPDRAADAAIVDVSDERTTSIELLVAQRIPVRIVTGIVTDANGTPLADNPFVSLYDREEPDLEISGVVADSNGRFNLPALDGRRYRIGASTISSLRFVADQIEPVTALESGRQDVPDDPAEQVRLVLLPRR